jgi:hypothetical protein
MCSAQASFGKRLVMAIAESAVIEKAESGSWLWWFHHPDDDVVEVEVVAAGQ